MVRYKAGKVATPPLSLAVKMWPSLTCGDAKNNGGKCHQESLQKEVGGNLNPTWVEWLMGWPLGWTDCAASGMDKFRLWLNSHGIH
jgi:DNA (cytosine-5)-methyltransferase 1